MLKLLRVAATDNIEYDVFLNRNGNVCCLEHDFGSPMIQDTTVDQACDWLIERGVPSEKAELAVLLSKLSKPN